ncbi:MAG TPA: Ig-like domain-containing protein [Gemmatimonadaceae bacterium]
MRRISVSALVGLAFAVGCGSESSTGVAPSSYKLEPTVQSLAIGQDSSVTLTVNVKRDGTDTTIKNSRLVFTSADYNIATVDGTGIVTGVRGGTTSIKVRLNDATADVPVTVRPHPATSVELTLLTGPGGGLKSVSADTGTFYALPADPLSAVLKAVVRVGNDTVFCNFCTVKTPARVMRQVRFVSLNPALATVSNAANPMLQASTDTTGRVTAFDTSTAGVRFVLEVPADNKSDTVLVKFSLRPIDSLGVRPDSNFFPTTNGTGLQKQIYPNADNSQANVKAASTTNFIVGIDFLSRVQNPPLPATPNTAGAVRYIPSRLYGSVTAKRPSLPNVTWESANTDYLDINAAGSVTGKCAAIGGSCLATGSTVLNCASASGAMPSAFLGAGTYSIPSCTPARSIPMPGALCTSASATDLGSTCTVWVRVTGNDQVTNRVMRSLYRVNIGR